MERELLPFRDRQDVKVYSRCDRCGRELYGALEVCGYCLRFFP